MKHLSHSSYYCGASHKADGREVQDYAGSLVIPLDDGTEAVVLSVSDGHGSKQHCRSASGSRMAVETCLEVLSAYRSQLNKQECDAFSIHGVGEDYCNDTEKLVREIIALIMAKWSRRVLEHLKESPLKSLMPGARAYGCTLLGAFVSERFWLVFQLGDGACACLDRNGKPCFPVPDDERCCCNVTTSMCSHGADDFRFVYGSKVPAAVMLCSDGVENSFLSREKLGTEFFVPLIAEIDSKGMAAVKADIAESLPLISERYSRDDVSLAFWTTEENAVRLAPALEAIHVTCRKMELQRLKADLDYCTGDINRIEADIADFNDEDENDAAELIRKHSVLATLRRQERELREDIEYLETAIQNFYYED
ncbi:MAG: protein phosphatase 2C domain-containing protein [Muribaculaceae bacterium]|nr:protein phosphatase 2C domain-containing protein [Muribaculaceae bacterium]